MPYRPDTFSARTVLDPERVTRRLGGTWHGGYGCAPCPLCQPERRADQRALSIAAGHSTPLVLYCWKGGCSFAQLAQALDLGAVERGQHCPGSTARPCEPVPTPTAFKRAEAARRCWAEAVPIAGTLAEAYLRARGITCALPQTLRYHPACWHGATAQRYPALVARVDGGRGFAVHRTYLRADGGGKADIAPSKAMLGATAGGAVRLTREGGALVVAGGIETALSLACGQLSTPVTGTAAIWAALSANGMTRLRLPDQPGHLILAADGDAVGRTAARRLAQRAAAAGWSITRLDPGDGRDFNDLLTAGGRR